MMKIYRGGEEILDVAINIGSKAKKELMADDYISLVFSLDDAIRLNVGDYVDDENIGWFILDKDYLPVYNAETGGFDYTAQFKAYYYSWNNKFLKYNPNEGASELSFNLTATIDVHVSLILENLVGAGFTFKGVSYTSNIDSSLVSEPKSLSYQNIHIVDAMTMIAEAFECEWWVEDNILNFGKCSQENGFEMEIGTSVVSMTPSSSADEYGTRLYVYGSEKNLPKNYRQTTGTVNAIVQKRLMLPEDTPYIDSKEGLTSDTAVEFVKFFDDIYPKANGVMSDVTSYDDSIENEEGEIITETFYRFKDSSIRFSEEYLLASELSIQFTSGKLNGMEFAVQFNPLGLPEKNGDNWNEDAQLFEIVANENYGRKLPDTILCPSNGDTYVLLNWDASKIADLGLVSKAEQELLEAGKKYLSEIDTDSKVYSCTLMSDIAEEMYMGNIRSLLNIGDSVILKNNVYFSPDGRKSRIIGYEYNLDIPYDSPVYTVGESPRYSRLKAIETDVDEIIYKGDTEKVFNTSDSIYVLSRKDKTPPSDKNVFSSLRSQLDFLRKNIDDIASGRITFEKGLEAHLISTLQQIIVRSSISSQNFSNGISGFCLNDENGVSELEVDRIMVRQTMTVVELLIQKMRSVGGQIIISPSDGKVRRITEDENSYTLYFETENTYVKDDLIRCQTFTGGNIKSYWVKVSFADAESVTIAKDEFMGWNFPEVGDETVLMGNASNTYRQNVITLSATEDGKPRIDVLDGIKGTSLEGCLRARLGSLEGIIDEYFGENQPDGYGLYSDNAYLKGEFVLRNTDESVETKFEVTDGSIKSAVGTLQNDMEHGKTILYNPSFTKGEDGWITSNAVIYYLLGDTPVYNNGKVVFNNAHDGSDPDYSNHRFILNITDGYIRQLNEYFVNKPDIANVNLVPISLGLKMMVEESGLLLTYLDGCDLDATKATAFKGVVTNEYWAGSNIAVSIPTLETSLSFMNTKADIWVGNEIMIAYINNNYKLFNLTTRKEIGTSLFVSPLAETDTISISEPVVFICGEEFTESEDYLQLEYVSRWNGTGHFNLAFGGGASIYSLQLFTNPVEARYATLFEQTDKLLKLSAMNFNDDGTIKQESGIVVQVGEAGLYARNDEGEQAKVAAYANGVVTLEGEHIQLKGNVTANGNVSIDDEGKLHAQDGEFEGKVTAKEGTIAEFEISENGLTYEAGAYTASFTKEAFVLGGEIEYIGLVARTKTFTVRGEDSVNEVSPLTIAERKLAVDEQNFANVPIVRIQDKSSFPTVALETTGAIYSNGSFIQRGALLKLTDAQSPNLITILKNTLWVISNNYQSNAFVYLPRLTRVRELLNINDDEFFAIPIEVLITHNSQYDSLIAVESESGESAYQYKIIDWNGGSDDYQRLSKGDSMRLLLIYDGETYYAQILRKTT